MKTREKIYVWAIVIQTHATPHGGRQNLHVAGANFDDACAALGALGISSQDIIEVERTWELSGLTVGKDEPHVFGSKWG